MEPYHDDKYETFRLALIRSQIRTSIKNSIFKFIRAFEIRGVLLSFLKKGGDISGESEQDVKDLKENMGELILDKFKNDFLMMESVIDEQIKYEMYRRIKQRKEDAPNNESFKKLKRFVERIKRPGGEPEEPDNEPDMCKYLNRYFSAGNLEQLDISFYAMTIFKIGDYYEDELDEFGNATGVKLLKDRLYHSFIIEREEMLSLLRNPFNGEEVRSLFETVLSSDSSYEMGDSKDNKLMTTREYTPKIDMLDLVNVTNQNVVNLVGTSIDKRESNWIEFWLKKTKNCGSEKYCRIVTENPLFNTLSTSTHNPTLYVKGGHIRIWGEKNKNHFLILPICSSHNARNRWDEGQGDGSRYMLAGPKSIAVKIKPIDIPSVRVKKRSIDDPTISINDLIEQTLKENTDFKENLKMDLENDYSRKVDQLLSQSLEKTIAWMNETYATTWDDFIPIWSEIKAAHQTNIMKQESMNKFKEFAFEKLSHFDFYQDFSNNSKNYFNKNNQIVDIFLDKVLLKVIG